MEFPAVHQDGELVVVLGKLALRVEFRHRRHRRPTRLGRRKTVGAAPVHQVIDQALYRRCAGTRAHEGQRCQRGGLGFLAGPGIVAHTGCTQELFLAGLFRGQFFHEHIEQFSAKFLAVQIHESQGRVRQRRCAKRVAFAMQAVGVREIRRLVDRERVQQHRLGVIVVGVQLRKARAQVVLRLVDGVRMHGDIRITRGAQGPERGRRDAPVRADTLGLPNPAAILLLRHHQRTDQRADAVAQALEFGGAGLGRAGKFQRGSGRQQVAACEAANARGRHAPVTPVDAALGPRREGVAQGHVDD